MAVPAESPSPPTRRTVTARGGRPRKYEDRAARQRAYRERLRLKAAAYDALPSAVKKSAAPADAAGKPRSGRELLSFLEASGIVGMWEHRKDIGDSLEFARQLRERAWTRSRD